MENILNKKDELDVKDMIKFMKGLTLREQEQMSIFMKGIKIGMVFAAETDNQKKSA